MEVMNMTNFELKSKVTTLANRLAPKMGGDKSAAFMKAWVICKAGAVTFPVRGVTVGSRQEALRRLNTYALEQIHAFLMPEPENTADRNAIAVMILVQGKSAVYKLGYVPANSTATAAAVRGKASIRIVSGAWGFNQRTFGARLTLAV
jgi:hypothetical protein